ncbi:hypothetical protein F5877DRAFT_86968 [Lentinula edodes]|nr:hypothetical protein F5877DRAFT_86968 [Lentinula edodes]
MKVFQLENPVTLQLGTKGSRSRISYGCTSKYRLIGGKHGDIEGTDYFDIANIDRYDAVLGTVFMRKHGIALDFENNVIRMHSKPTPTLTEGEENREIARRYAKTMSSTIHLKNGEELPVKTRPHKHERAQSDRVSPLWSRYATTIEEQLDEDEIQEKPSLNRNLPVLLDPTDEVTIDDIEDMIAEVTTGSYADPGHNARLHEVGELVEEFRRQKFKDTNNEVFTPKPIPTVIETMNAASERFKERTSNSSPSLKQTRYSEKDIPRLREIWLESCKDIMSGVPEEMPPFR